MRDSQPTPKSPSSPAVPSDRDPFDLLEAYVDGELNGEDRRFVEQSLATTPGLAAELALARRVQSGLRTMPKQRCPEAVSRRVLNQIASETREASSITDEPKRPPRSAVSTLGGWVTDWRAAFAAFGQRPARLAAGLALIAIAWISHHTLVGLSGMSPSTPALTVADSHGLNAERDIIPSPSDGLVDTPSAQEVARAEQEVKLALAYLGKLGRTAGKSVVQITGESAGQAKRPNS